MIENPLCSMCITYIHTYIHTHNYRMIYLLRRCVYIYMCICIQYLCTYLHTLSWMMDRALASRSRRSPRPGIYIGRRMQQHKCWVGLKVCIIIYICRYATLCVTKVTTYWAVSRVSIYLRIQRESIRSYLGIKGIQSFVFYGGENRACSFLLLHTLCASKKGQRKGSLVHNFEQPY